MDPSPSQPIDESGPVGPFTEAPDEPAPADIPTSPDRTAIETVDGVDLDAVAADLADVERAMERLEAATYWTDEVTGAPLDDALLTEHPTARRSGPGDPPPLSSAPPAP